MRLNYAGTSISINPQNEHIAQHSCVTEPRESNSNETDSKEDNESSEETDFVSVQKHKVRHLYLGSVREGVNKQTITNYMQKKGISPTFMRLFKSKRKGTVAARVNVKSVDFKTVSDNEFWPKHDYFGNASYGAYFGCPMAGKNIDHKKTWPLIANQGIYFCFLMQTALLTTKNCYCFLI